MTKTPVSNGFTDAQTTILGELLPLGFADRLKSAGLDPRTFRLSVGEKAEEKEENQNQLNLFDGGVNKNAYRYLRKPS